MEENQNVKIKRKLLLVGGIAGSGKSTIADYISKGYPFVYIDKDFVTRPMVEKMLEDYGSIKSDRESSTYVEKVRPYEYEQFFETLFEVIKNNYTVGAAPFLKEFQDKEWIYNLKKEADKKNVDLVLIWVHTEPYETEERLISRGAERDIYKINHFEEYAKSMSSVTENIENMLMSVSDDIKVHIINNYNGTLEETFSTVDFVVYNINNL